jgi:GTPase SAR1 family protein
MVLDIRFKTPFNLIVSGMSGSGKTTWVKNLLKLKDQIFEKEPAQVILFYKAMQDIYLEMENEGLISKTINVNTSDFPTLEELQNMVHEYKDNGSLLIFDDIMTDISTDFENMFCNLSHHENASIIFLTQNLFYKNKSFRTMSLNSHYMVLMKNDRDKQQISILARQFSPNNSNFIIQAYEEATKNPYDYLLLDFRPSTPQNLRVRSRIFPHQFPTTVYFEK